MTKYTIASKEYGTVLVGLKKLIGAIEFDNIEIWAFRKMTLRCKLPFGISLSEFEHLTKQLQLGFIVSNEDFQAFLKTSEFEIIDGLLYGYKTKNLETPLLIIECIDSAQWGISTNSETIAAELTRRNLT